MAQIHPALHSIFIKSTLLQFLTQKKWFYQKICYECTHLFLAFRTYINFYFNLKIEPATRPDLHLNFLKCTQCKKSCFLLFFELGNSDHYDHLCLVNFEREKVTGAHFWTTSAWSLFDPAIQICF